MSFPKSQVSIDQLEFDIENPRLVRGDGSTPTKVPTIIKTLHEIADLSELINSICANGYLDIEPIIILDQEGVDHYIVLEGNRRLATLKLILDSALAEECNISVSDECRTKLSGFNTINAVIVKDRLDAEAYIAFKHVNGPFRWDSYAKARFVTDWYIRGIKADKPVSIEDIAKSIGDSNDTIRSFISAMLILDQAEEDELFSISDKYNRGRFGFSHLYTALGRKEYTKYLDLEPGWNKNPELEPLKTDKQKERIREILQYLYGSKAEKIKPIIKSQNPDLRNLGLVISNPIALSVLNDTRDLEEALAETEESSDLFGKTLANCYVQLRKAQGLVDKYEGEEYLLKMANDIHKMSQIILEYIEKNVPKG